MNSADHRALSVCCKVDRDVVIEEQRATIARQAHDMALVVAENDSFRRGGPVYLEQYCLIQQQQREIYRLEKENDTLRRGDGPIGAVLAASLKRIGVEAGHDILRNPDTTVGEYLDQIRRAHSGVGHMLMFGVPAGTPR